MYFCPNPACIFLNNAVKYIVSAKIICTKSGEIMDEILSAYVFNAVDRDCGPWWSLERGVLGHHNLMFITDGACDFFIDGRRLRLSAGDVIYYPVGSERAANTIKPSERTSTPSISTSSGLIGCRCRRSLTYRISGGLGRISRAFSSRGTKNPRATGSSVRAFL